MIATHPDVNAPTGNIPDRAGKKGASSPRMVIHAALCARDELARNLPQPAILVAGRDDDCDKIQVGPI